MNTAILKVDKKTHSHSATRAGLIPALVLPILFFALALALPEVSRDSVAASLRLCACSLIPSLFPFTVAGEMLISLYASGEKRKRNVSLFETIFGISGNGAIVFLLGAVCGLPLGGRYAVSLYEKGTITREDCESLIGISTNAGVGFTVVGIGVSLFGSARFGWLLYFTQIFSAITAGRLLKRERSVDSIAPVNRQTDELSFSRILTDSIVSSAFSMLKICGFVVFFGVVTDFIKLFASLMGLPATLTALMCAMTEITSACSFSSGMLRFISPVTAQSAHIITFFAVGYAGLCAHMQVASFASRAGISMRRYHLTKLLTGLISAVTGSLILHFIPI